MLVGRAMGHMNSEVNLARSRRLQEDGTEKESVNAKWQCEAVEVSYPWAAERMKRRGVRLAIGLLVVPANCTETDCKEGEKAAASVGRGGQNICVRVVKKRFACVVSCEGQ